jgi:aryl-alcohol dehydrogenase-like predicted oxidoreductase
MWRELARSFWGPKPAAEEVPSDAASVTRRPLGSSGIEVNPIGLGGMPLSCPGRPPEAQAVQVIHAALDAGVDFIDTADVYCLDQTDIGHNERLIAGALKERKEQRVTVATKGGLERPGGEWTRNGHPDHLRSACERSLRSLSVETIDLYQLHSPDEKVPFADSVGALAELRQAGKIRNVGLSNVSVHHIRKAREIVPIVSVQNRCNVFDLRAFQDGVVAYCEAEGIAFVPWNPVGGAGGKAKTAQNRALRKIGERHGVSPFRVALAWLLARSPVMVPIPGATRVATIGDSAKAMTMTLSRDDLSVLDRAFPQGSRRAT